MAVGEKLITAEEFWEIAQQPDNEQRRLELINGVIIEVAPSSVENSVIAGLIISFLNIYIRPKKLGYVTVPDAGYKLGPYTVRQPDAAFVSKARAPKKLPKVFQGAPDLAVEIVSPREDVLDKVYDYLHAGTKLVWAVYPGRQTVRVFQLEDDGSLRGREYGVKDILDGGSVLPGFTLPVRDIFPE